MVERMILVDADVFAALQSRAEPLVDDANSVLRRVLELPPESEAVQGQRVDSPRSSPPIPAEAKAASPRSVKAPAQIRQAPRIQKKGHSRRPPRGALLPEDEYVLPLLEALVELSGSAPTSAVVQRAGEKLEPKLTALDRKRIKSGDVRWKNRLQFVRLGLIKQGLMKKDSPRGIWEVSESGRELLSNDKKRVQ